jgi:hypothetical protein
MHHLFVSCTVYTEWRIQAGVKLVTDTEKKFHGLLEDAELKAVEAGFLEIAESILSDDSPRWPLQKNIYYLGKHPSLKNDIIETMVKSDILWHRII